MCEIGTRDRDEIIHTIVCRTVQGIGVAVALTVVAAIVAAVL